jgi:hypothetical protein
MNNFFITAAYKYVALMVVLAEANFFTEKVHLPLDNPITEQDMRPGGQISPPRLMGFGGSLLTDTYFFGFGKGGLANFKKLRFEPDNEAAIRERNFRFADMKSLIGTNEAYQLATNWLIAIGVEVQALESKYPPKVTQRRYYPDAKGLVIRPEPGQRELLMPIFDLQWGNIPFVSGGRDYPMPALSLAIFGPTKELIEFHLMDRSLSRRPEPIKDFEKLLAIPDVEFNTYTATQRSNLVIRFVHPEFQYLIFDRTHSTNAPPAAAESPASTSQK